MNAIEAIHIRKSPIVLGLKIVGTVLLIEVALVLAGLFFIGIRPGNMSVQMLARGLVAMQIIAFLAILYLVFKVSASWISNTAYISDHHLVIVYNFMSRREKLYELSSLKSFDVRQSWLGRNFGYGNIEMLFATSGLQYKLLIQDIQEPQSYQELFEKFLHEEEGMKVVQYPETQTVNTQPKTLPIK